MPELSHDQVAERLKAITIELIAAHRTDQQTVLDRYARQSGVWDGPPDPRPQRLFMKLIQVYHPDRLRQLLDRIAAARAAGDEAGLLAVRRLLAALRGGPAAGAAGAAGKTPEATGFEAEAYRWEIDPADLGFGEAAWHDHDDGAPLRHERSRRRATISVLEAMKREHFGNLDLDLTRHDLEEMDGDLDLPDMDIESLAGLQLCRHLTGLNLAANRINDINPLRFLRNLEWLDLSGNQVDDADCLEKLTRLEELDLSDNQIEDIGFLESLPRLRFVNLSGNPLFRPEAIIDRLAAAGVLVTR